MKKILLVLTFLIVAISAYPFEGASLREIKASNFEVISVPFGTNAYNAGLLSGDIITAVNGQKFTYIRDLYDYISRLHQMDKISVTVNRLGRIFEIEIKR